PSFPDPVLIPGPTNLFRLGQVLPDASRPGLNRSWYGVHVGGRPDPRSFRVPTDAQAAEPGWSPRKDVAGQSSHTLINLTLPVLSLTRSPGFLKALLEHA